MARAGRHETQTVRSASISEMLGHPRHPVMVDPSCGWPSISEMLGPRIASLRGVPGCGWPSISEMLGRWGVRAMSTAQCGWASNFGMLGLCGTTRMMVRLLRLAGIALMVRQHATQSRYARVLSSHQMFLV